MESELLFAQWITVFFKRLNDMRLFRENSRRASATLFVLLFVAGLLIGGLLSFYVTYQQTRSLQTQVAGLRNAVSVLESQLSTGGGNFSVTNQSITIYQNDTYLADIYSNVRDSIVLVQGTSDDGSVQGSGFVYQSLSRMVVITNFHVVHNTDSLSVTFSNGHGYAATVLGSDPYADLAIISVDDAPANEFKPVQIVSSSSLRVGDPVIAIGNPYGLVGSLTTGVVSALGRTLRETELASGYSIANIIQASTPINPGNSGGPLLNALGNVVGVTTAIVSESQGLGFAVPSNTILREVNSLITTGTYGGHSYLGVTGGDVDYNIAGEQDLSVTYGWRLASVNSSGPSGGKLRVDDILIAINGTTIRNYDDMASFLEEKALPGETVIFTVIRDNSTIEVDVVLGVRPPPPI